MEPDAFVKELAALAPTSTELERLGFSKDEASRSMESFLCTKREHPLQAAGDSNELLRLLSNWDLSKIEIGMIRFPNPPAELLGTICVGCVEADPLLLLPDTGEVAVHELGIKGKRLWWVARSGSELMDSMFIAARFLEGRGSGRIDFNDHSAARVVALECASAAGGDKYLDFYTMLLGAE
jgi:hypothetical protein